MQRKAIMPRLDALTSESSEDGESCWGNTRIISRFTPSTATSQAYWEFLQALHNEINKPSKAKALQTTETHEQQEHHTQITDKLQHSISLPASRWRAVHTRGAPVEESSAIVQRVKGSEHDASGKVDGETHSRETTVLKDEFEVRDGIKERTETSAQNPVQASAGHELVQKTDQLQLQDPQRDSRDLSETPPPSNLNDAESLQQSSGQVASTPDEASDDDLIITHVHTKKRPARMRGIFKRQQMAVIGNPNSTPETSRSMPRLKRSGPWTMDDLNVLQEKLWDSVNVAELAKTLRRDKADVTNKIASLTAKFVVYHSQEQAEAGECNSRIKKSTYRRLRTSSDEDDGYENDVDESACTRRRMSKKRRRLEGKDRRRSAGFKGRRWIPPI